MDACAALAKVLEVREDDSDILQFSDSDLEDDSNIEFDPCCDVGDDDDFIPSEEELDDGAEEDENVEDINSATATRSRSPLSSTRGGAPRGVAVDNTGARSS